MQLRFHILFLFVCLFLSGSADRALACVREQETTCEQTAAYQSCCSEAERTMDAHCSGSTDGCAQTHPGQECPDDDGCGGCHCPACGAIPGGHTGGLIAECDPVLPVYGVSSDMQQQAFYFAQHMPEAVYLPIWQPPQWAA